MIEKVSHSGSKLNILNTVSFANVVDELTETTCSVIDVELDNCTTADIVVTIHSTRLEQNSYSARDSISHDRVNNSGVDETGSSRVDRLEGSVEHNECV